ncbi:MAG: M42 family metallopeptidase [Ruminococcus sp.]|nr:M42 family metallopeptidase [Ruminococcus sp.]
MNLKELIFELCQAPGVSGSEEPALEIIKKYISPFAKVSTDSNGSLFATLGNENAEKTILVDAHIDRIGFVVTDINENGFVKIDACGGIDARVLQNTELAAQSDPELVGVVCCLPPHLTDGSEDKATPVSKTWVDFGMPRAELEKRLKIGAALTFSSKPRELLNGRISAPALDNRCGAAALIRMCEIISGMKTPYKVTALFSSQEETFALGAKTGAFKLEPDEAIAVDVSFASQPDISGQYSKIGLSKGPMIGISPVLNRKMTDRLIELARKQDIPYQLEPLASSTGTNAEHIACSKGGIKTALVSIPQRYMHTQNEVISVLDVENTARLLAEYIICGGAADA